MGALEDVCRDGPRTRDVGGEATTQEVGDAIAARGQRTIPMTRAARDDERAGDHEPSADSLVVPPDQHGGEDDRPQRLGRVQRRDDRHAAVVERREQEDVAEPEGEPAGA